MNLNYFEGSLSSELEKNKRIVAHVLQLQVHVTRLNILRAENPEISTKMHIFEPYFKSSKSSNIF